MEKKALTIPEAPLNSLEKRLKFWLNPPSDWKEEYTIHKPSCRYVSPRGFAVAYEKLLDVKFHRRNKIFRRITSCKVCGGLPLRLEAFLGDAERNFPWLAPRDEVETVNQLQQSVERFAKKEGDSKRKRSFVLRLD